ncbi:cation:proton antiporter [Salinisphaera sp. T31B1]|uniref:cation:proton antiporter domain-containing protein n=1 Tax=Salinisphaera sp. T31B1 TaxID=727963 RepID=UPI0033411E5E
MELIWLALALGGGLAAARLQLPVFVGYLMVGLALGLVGQQSTPLLVEAGEIGVLLLLFGVGLHLRPATLFNRPVLIGGGLHLTASLLVLGVVAWALGLTAIEALLCALLLSFSSTVLAAKTLDTAGELGAFHGRLAIGILIVQDCVAVLVMIAVSETALSWWTLIVLPGLACLRWPLLWLLSAIDSDELLLLAAALLALGVARLFTELGLSAELGAIAAGALVAAHPRGQALAAHLWAVKELLLSAFFLSVGLQVSPGLTDWALAAALALLLPAKAWLFFALLVSLGLRARTAFLTGNALTSYSEFTLIAGMAAHAQGLLSSTVLSVLTLATVLSFVIHLPHNRLGHAIYDRFERGLRAFERDVPHPDEPVASIGAAHYLVLGMGRTGTAAYDFLRRSGQTAAGLDTDPDVLSRHVAAERRVAYGDAQDRELWRDLRLRSVRGAVVALPNAPGRLRATRLLREYAPQLVISTFAMHAHEAEALREAGADNVSYLLAEAGERMAELSCTPADPGTDERPRLPS